VDDASARGAEGAPWFYLRLNVRAPRGDSQVGLTLIRVLREGLWFQECFGHDAVGADRPSKRDDETASRTHVRDPEATRAGTSPTRDGFETTDASALEPPTTLDDLDRTALPFSRGEE
jgi:hypothetical protein